MPQFNNTPLHYIGVQGKYIKSKYQKYDGEMDSVLLLHY